VDVKNGDKILIVGSLYPETEILTMKVVKVTDACLYPFMTAVEHEGQTYVVRESDMAPVPYDYDQERELFEKSFGRPRNYRQLSHGERWTIDKNLGILDWDGKYLSPEDHLRIKEHYE